MSDLQNRIDRLLDQLENPDLTVQDIEKIEQKIEVLKKLNE